MRIHSYLELPLTIPEAEAAPFEEAMVDNGLQLRSKKKVVPFATQMYRPVGEELDILEGRRGARVERGL